MSSETGQGNPIPLIIVSLVVILPLSVFSLYKLIYFHQKKKNTSRFMYINQIVFYLSCVVFAVVYPLVDILEYLSVPWRIVWALDGLTHGLLHFYALINIFYERLINVFNETELALKRKTKIVFNTLYIIMMLLGAVSWVIIQIIRDQPNSLTIMAMLALPYLLIMVGITQFLSFMFIYKLYKINKLVGGDQLKMNHIKPLIAKFTVLSVIAMSGTIFYIMFIGASQAVTMPQWFINVMKSVDLSTNLICVTLSYQLFDKYYNGCCYLCIIGCKYCCLPSAETQLATNIKKRQIACTKTETNINVSYSPNTVRTIHRQQFLKDNKLSCVMNIFEEQDIAIEELIEFTISDLRAFAEENGLTTLQKNRLVNGIQLVKTQKRNRSNTCTETNGEIMSTYNSSDNQEPNSMNEITITRMQSK